MPDNREFMKDLLLEDYRYRAEALRHSEQSGETRVNIFMGLMTLVAGGLVTLSDAEYGVSPHALRLIIVYALVVLVVVGILTLIRLLIRNKHTDECKRDLDHIRQVFKDVFDQESLLGVYFPVGKPGPPSEGNGIRGLGGLAHLMAGFNSLLLATALFLSFLPVSLPEKLDIVSGELLLPSGAAVLTFLIAFILQSSYVAHRERSHKCNVRMSSPTHAGGIVYKNEGNETLYLVISTKDNQQNTWVLPKGHIESGESDGEAALREVQEETGVVAQLMRPIGEVRYIVGTGAAKTHTSAKFYLMRWLFDAPEKRSEGRVLQWLPFEHALRKLTFPEGKRMLLLAHAKIPR